MQFGEQRRQREQSSTGTIGSLDDGLRLTAGFPSAY